jgi:hypothetical protein
VSRRARLRKTRRGTEMGEIATLMLSLYAAFASVGPSGTSGVTAMLAELSGEDPICRLSICMERGMKRGSRLIFSPPRLVFNPDVRYTHLLRKEFSGPSCATCIGSGGFLASKPHVDHPINGR